MRRALIGLVALVTLTVAVLGGLACKKGDDSAGDMKGKTPQTTPPGGKGPSVPGPGK